MNQQLFPEINRAVTQVAYFEVLQKCVPRLVWRTERCLLDIDSGAWVDVPASNMFCLHV